MTPDQYNLVEAFADIAMYCCGVAIAIWAVTELFFWIAED